MENHGQKRSADEQLDVLDGVQALLLDIEGTTTPITFVKDTLFPYIRENVESYIKTHFDDEECRADIELLRKQVKAEKEATVGDIPEGDNANKDAVIEAAVKYVVHLMDKDSKTTALKQLQGHMWREAYMKRLVQGEVYDDVVPAIKHWLYEGRKAYIYSSGSVEAQKLLFGYSDKGNLLQLFSGHYDTTIGAKVDKDSYTNISQDIGLKPEQIAFFTDLPREAIAADAAGFRTVIVIKDGNAPLSDEDKQRFFTIKSFKELTNTGFENTKRLEGYDDEDDDDDLHDLRNDGDDFDEDYLDDLDDVVGDDDDGDGGEDYGDDPDDTKE